MNRDDIIRMAREAGIIPSPGSQAMLDRFAALVAAAEREACAGLCQWKVGIHAVDAAIETCAAAIRARGQDA